MVPGDARDPDRLRLRISSLARSNADSIEVEERPVNGGGAGTGEVANDGLLDDV